MQLNTLTEDCCPRALRKVRTVITSETETDLFFKMLSVFHPVGPLPPKIKTIGKMT